MNGMFSSTESFNQPLKFVINQDTEINSMFEFCPISEKNKPVFRILI